VARRLPQHCGYAPLTSCESSDGKQATEREESSEQTPNQTRQIRTEIIRETMAKCFHERTKSKIDFQNVKHSKNDQISSDGKVQQAAV